MSAVLAGFGLTPLALAAAPIATRAKVPEVVMAAATSSITAGVALSSCARRKTVPQIADTMGVHGRQRTVSAAVVTIVTDYGPGIDYRDLVQEKLSRPTAARCSNRLRVPLANPDFAPFLQRAADAKPQAVFVFVPSGPGGVFIRQFAERGLDKARYQTDRHWATSSTTTSSTAWATRRSASSRRSTTRPSHDSAGQQILRRRLPQRGGHAAELHGGRRL